ncbi:MAG TPA: YciI family protein [Terriglobales bacterium]|nr:YciI family protein [Terriglobales bacterium]
MKFVCLGYIAPGKFEGMSETERNNWVDLCTTYDDELKKLGHFAGGEALQPANTAKTLRPKDGQVVVTDGPYAETKEQIGGFLLLEARNLDHAVELMSQHPGVKHGPSTFEIRPVADMTEIFRESERRRRSK